MKNEIIKRLCNDIKEGHTLLGIGPMSKNIVDASIELADENDVLIMFISSRRQIDDANISRGYVNNWSTEEFAKYVRTKSTKNNIILARDHGGPWQNNFEIKNRFSLKEAMLSAKDSFAKDIDAGFDILHIDPSIDIYEQLSFEKIFDRLADLYEYCSCYANQKNKNIEFEIGTEEQMIHINPVSEFTFMLNKVSEFCIKNGFKIPLFVVSQIGTKVMETKNIGVLVNNNSKMFNDIEKLCSIALEKGFFVKVHNTDYLADSLLRKFPQLKIGAANVAPEFGVCETKSFLNLLEKYYLISLENEFLELAYKSNKWEKWVMPGSKITNRDKAIIAGHYIFANDEFHNIKDKAQQKIKDINIDDYLKSDIKTSINKYMTCFGMLSEKRKVING